MQGTQREDLVKGYKQWYTLKITILLKYYSSSNWIEFSYVPVLSLFVTQKVYIFVHTI